MAKNKSQQMSVEMEEKPIPPAVGLGIMRSLHPWFTCPNPSIVGVRSTATFGRTCSSLLTLIGQHRGLASLPEPRRFEKSYYRLEYQLPNLAFMCSVFTDSRILPTPLRRRPTLSFASRVYQELRNAISVCGTAIANAKRFPSENLP